MLVTPTVLRVKTGLQPRKGRIIQAQLWYYLWINILAWRVPLWSILASKIEIEPKLLQTKLANSLYQLLNQFCISRFNQRWPLTCFRRNASLVDTGSLVRLRINGFLDWEDKERWHNREQWEWKVEMSSKTLGSRFSLNTKSPSKMQWNVLKG